MLYYSIKSFRARIVVKEQSRSNHLHKKTVLVFTIVSTYLKFAFFWLYKGNQYEFLTHPKIKGLDGGLEPPTSGLPVHCSTT